MASAAASRRYYQEQFVERGYVSVPFDMQGSDIDQVFDQFREVLSLCYDDAPDNRFVEALAYKPPNRSAGGDYWIDKRRKGEINPYSANPAPATEDKDCVHIGPRSYERAHNRLQGNGGVPYVMRAFMDTCVELQQEARKSVRPVFKALGLEGTMFAQDPLDEEDVVRTLGYPATSEPTLAELHLDRSAFTLAPRETHPGLAGAPGNNGLRQSLSLEELDTMAERAHVSPIKHTNRQAKLFAGAGYNRLPESVHANTDPLPLLLHKVDNKLLNTWRGAVVIFMHPPAYTPGYIVPSSSETGFADIRARIARLQGLQDDVA